MSKNAEVPIELIKDIIRLHGNCRYDHHGYCQEHNLQMKDECWVYKLEEILRKDCRLELKNEQ